MLYNLIYISKVHQPLSNDDLVNLLARSRAWNESKNISGMLLYIPAIGEEYAGRFMQVLEGEEANFQHLFEKIKANPRHSQITILNEGKINKRQFEDWTMGYQSLDIIANAHLPGFFELDKNFIRNDSAHKFSVARNFLELFYYMQPLAAPLQILKDSNL